MNGYASVCVLSYQRPEFLAECIDAIHAHADYPFELIVHDDGSTDLAAQSFLKVALQEGKISTVIGNPPGHNQGVGTAINRMFNMASGDFMVKLDQDVLVNPGFLRRTAEIFEQNRQRPGTHDLPRIGVLGLLHYHHEPVDSTKTRITDHGYMEEHTHILGSAFAVPRDVWERRGPLAEHSDAFSEDWEFMNRITSLPYCCCALPKEDLCINRGFGVGPSTVVTGHDGSVQAIHHGPVVFGC